MKKTLSLVLVLVMLAAMLVPMSVSASATEANTLLKTYDEANDGDKLIDLLFGQTTGAFQSRLFCNGIKKGAIYMGSPYATVSADGSSVEMVYSREGEPAETADKDVYGNFLYGGKINGLKAGIAADGSTYKYTFTFSALFNHTATTNGNTGFYFTMHENLIENTTEDGILYMNKGDSDEHLGAYGWYGHPYKQNNGETQMRYHVIRNEGQSAKNGGNRNNYLSSEYKAAMKAGAGEWYDIVIEIDGYKMNAYFNGLELGLGDSLGMFDMTAEATASNGNTSDLAFIGRMFNCLNTVSIKNVSVYKGIGIDFSNIPEDTTAPETTAPETTVPETTAPETTVPETTVPETTVPETTVPETTVPETTVPETTVPETTVPETTVPETTVPETTVPETTVPETTVPSTPDTSAPADDTTAPVVDDTTAPVVDDTTAPVVDDTTAPVVDDTTAPVVDDTTAPAADTTAPSEPETGDNSLAIVLAIVAVAAIGCVAINLRKREEN